MTRILVVPEQLRSLAARYRSNASNIESILRDLNHSLNIPNWHGSHRGRAIAQWNGERARLQRLAESARSLGSQVQRVADSFDRADRLGARGVSSVARNYTQSSVKAVRTGLYISPLAVPFLDKGIVPVVTTGLDRLQESALQRLSFRPGSSHRLLRVSGRNVDRRLAGLNVMTHRARYGTIEQRVLAARANRHTLAKAGVTVAISGGLNLYSNWRDHGNEGTTRVVTGTVADTAVDITLMSVGGVAGGVLGGAVGGAIGGPFGAAIGIKVGGFVGSAVGSWASERFIKQQDWYDSALDSASVDLEKAGRGVGEFVSGAFQTIRRESGEVADAIAPYSVTRPIAA